MDRARHQPLQGSAKTHKKEREKWGETNDGRTQLYRMAVAGEGRAISIQHILLGITQGTRIRCAATFGILLCNLYLKY